LTYMAGATVAVCVGSYNQAQYLRECIMSVLAQTYPIQGIWVSDDASVDGTSAIMSELCEQYPKIHYHRQQRNIGISENLSWVLSQPNTDLIGRIDSDDRYTPFYIEKLVALMSKYPCAGYAHCDVREIDSRGALRRIRRLNRTIEYESAQSSLRHSASGYRVAANCILFRKEALRKVEYYRPNLSWKSAEDWDLSIRMAIHGWGNVYMGVPLAEYRTWESPGSTRQLRKIDEIERLTWIYKNRLEIEYRKRGWSISALDKCRRRAALGYADILGAKIFNKEELEEARARMRQLGSSLPLSIAIMLAKAKLGFIMHAYIRIRLIGRDCIKKYVVLVRRRFVR